MNQRAQRLLWLDGGGGTAVGLLILALRGWLVELYAMPLSTVMFISFANVAYGAYSGSLAVRASRQKTPSRRAIDVLWVANLAWSVVCIGLVANTFRSASVFGLGHVVLEGLFVAGLAVAELRYVRPHARH